MSLQARNITATMTSAYTAKTNDVVPVDATTAAFSVALPLPINGVGLAPITIGPKLDATANAVTITTPAGTIKGTASLAAQFDVVTYTSDGVNWFALTHAGASGGGAPTGAASGDLSGTYPGPTVAKVNGVAVTGTPTAGQVPIASSGSAAAWGTVGTGGAPSGAAGGDLAGSYPNPTVSAAAGIKSATTTVAVSAATAPTSGQVLTATGGTAATWQTPLGGGGAVVYGPPCGWVGAETFSTYVSLPTNRCYLYRSRGGGTITGITTRILNSAGNISVGIVGSAGGLSNPVTRRVTSGAIACPAVGYAVVTIASTTVDPSDWIALSHDLGTATFSAGPSGAISENFTVPFTGSGQMMFMSAAHPVPSTVTVTGTLTGAGHILSGA